MTKEVTLKEVTLLQYNPAKNLEEPVNTSYHDWIFAAIRVRENQGLNSTAMKKVNDLKKIIRDSKPGDTIMLSDENLKTLKELVKRFEGVWTTADDAIIEFNEYIKSL